MTDPIADLLTRMRNAMKARQAKTVVPHSGMKCALLEVLKNHRYIADFRVVKNGAFQEIEITFSPRQAFQLKRVSKPGQRIYLKKQEIRPVCNGMGIGVYSTPKGLLTGKEARAAGVGGEYLCEIW